MSIQIESLRNRIRAMSTLWQRAVEDMTLDQVNHHERAGVLPIAFSLNHYMRGQDSSISRVFLREEPLWAQGDWARRVGVTVDRYEPTESLETMERLRFGDFEAWKAYQAEVIARTNRVLDAIRDDELEDVVIPSLPADSKAFCALVVGPGNPVRKLEVLECFVFQHGIRHLGELEHARALVGLTGLSNLA
jgi:DinB superfamily